MTKDFGLGALIPIILFLIAIFATIDYYDQPPEEVTKDHNKKEGK